MMMEKIKPNVVQEEGPPPGPKGLPTQVENLGAPSAKLTV